MSVPDDLYAAARLAAARTGTTVTELVRDFLVALERDRSGRNELTPDGRTSEGSVGV